MQTWKLLVQLIIKVPIIASYQHRKRWQERFDENTTIVAIYNSGWNLFYDQKHSPATTHYDYQWSWIFYRNFCEPRYILANKNFSKRIPTRSDMIVIQHLGHDEFKTARILTRSCWTGARYEHVKIPARHILYIAVKNGKILGRTIVYKHLPGKLIKTIGGLLAVSS
jgi:hypothetical protein